MFKGVCMQKVTQRKVSRQSGGIVTVASRRSHNPEDIRKLRTGPNCRCLHQEEYQV